MDRSRAESFGEVAELYDRSRPSYPPELIDALLADDARRVLDVGCGTGIAAALLAARGAEVLGIEIDLRMARLARAKGLAVEVGAFERWDRAGRRFDLVTSAQAWHWIDPRAGAAAAAAALVPGGRLGLFWNFGDPPEHVRELLGPIYDRLEPGVENYSRLGDPRPERARATIAGLATAGGFTAAAVTRFPWTRRYDTAAWLDHLATQSDHNALVPDRRARLLAAVGEAIDSVGGFFDLLYETVLVSAHRRARGRAGGTPPAA